MTDFFYKASGTLTPELDMKIVLKLETWYVMNSDVKF